MKVGDIVLAADARTLKFKSGVIVEKMDLAENAKPFGMSCWMILVDGKVRQYTDAAIRKIK